LDVLESVSVLSVRARLRNVWRLRLGVALLRLAGWVLRSHIYADIRLGDELARHQIPCDVGAPP
jgi:hypothetical protein